MKSKWWKYYKRSMAPWSVFSPSSHIYRKVFSPSRKMDLPRSNMTPEEFKKDRDDSRGGHAKRSSPGPFL
jgi:hypothetical protein